MSSLEEGGLMRNLSDIVKLAGINGRVGQNDWC